ncbi:hypothetical protein [Halomarina oriensis]|uniref:Uncharacterized protein n=1 Tax=Halomarina oriensis TaxID=671145 RepID=A0A6B0GWL4_9EURY|nr:hypothetical protein [Halomarina oriensis]MWG36535.1 hypothetical protein [Halomarina oriensis]
MTTKTTTTQDSIAPLRIPSRPVAVEAAAQEVRARVTYRSRRTGTDQTVTGTVVDCVHSDTADDDQYTLHLETDEGHTVFACPTLRNVVSKTSRTTRLGRLLAIDPVGDGE